MKREKLLAKAIEMANNDTVRVHHKKKEDHFLSRIRESRAVYKLRKMDLEFEEYLLDQIDMDYIPTINHNIWL